MIKCPVCKHEEMDGTLFCSECGSRLWQGGPEDDTANLSTSTFSQSGSGAAQTISDYTSGVSTQQIYVRIGTNEDNIALPSDKTEYLIGRSDPKNNIIPEIDLGPYGGQMMGVSRRHAVILRDQRGLSVRDLGSTNGTLVNSRLLKANETRFLRDGDEIRLGKLSITIFFKEE